MSKRQPPREFGESVLIVTCEHGGNSIPAPYADCFGSAKAKRALLSHRGYDPGALLAANVLAPLATKVVSSVVSRLLVDLNRSIDHPSLFSEFTSGLGPERQREILDAEYVPYRSGVEACIRDWIESGRRVVHVSVHSFTPVFGGKSRQMDIGWLYDPGRMQETSIVDRWLTATAERLPRLRLRRNAPYQGTDDGFTTALRCKWSDAQYAGIEIELSQGFARREERLRPIAEALQQTLAQALEASDVRSESKPCCPPQTNPLL